MDTRKKDKIDNIINGVYAVLWLLGAAYAAYNITPLLLGFIIVIAASAYASHKSDTHF